MSGVPEVVERAARAICAPRCDREFHPCDTLDGLACKPEKCRRWQNYVDSARAAIAAMREPTSAMRKGTFLAYAYGEAERIEYYQAMIDTALTAPASEP